MAIVSIPGSPRSVAGVGRGILYGNREVNRKVAETETFF